MAERKQPALWSPEALADIDQIWDYYARVAGSKTANDLLAEIGKVVALIEEHRLWVALATKFDSAFGHSPCARMSSSIASLTMARKSSAFWTGARISTRYSQRPIEILELPAAGRRAAQLDATVLP